MDATPDVQPESASPSPQRRRRTRAGVPLFGVDAGWLFLLVGIGVLACTILIPAQHDLEMARWQRDRAAAIEKHRLERVDRYATYLKAVDRGSESVVLSLAAVQLNQSPVDRIPLTISREPADLGASVFTDLEPAPPVLPPKPVVTERSSILARWTIDDQTRLWLLAGGLVCVLIGLLPPSTRAMA